MSVRRLLLTTTGMAGIAWALAGLVPDVPVMTDVLGHPQHTADTSGADTLVLAAVGVLAWLVWAWGTLGLALTAISALPGVLGTAAGNVLRVVLPAGARRTAALALGVSLGVTGPFVATAWPTAAAAAAVARDAAPDWPVVSPADWPLAAAPATTTDRGTVPDWPRTSPTSATDVHVVVRGDCLWSIAEAGLARDHRRVPSAGEVADAVTAWWSANDTVIGPDPDVLLPGQILRGPGPS
jgi:hypothetical protein